MDERINARRWVDGNTPFELGTDPDWNGDRYPDRVTVFEEEMVIGFQEIFKSNKSILYQLPLNQTFKN